MTFTDIQWQAVAPTRQAIAAQPFLAELAAGTLPAETFRHYIVQDSLYLAEYARALALAAAKAPTSAARLEFSDGAKVAVEVEAALHQAFFAQFGVTAEMAAAAEPSPVCLAYTSYLNALAARRATRRRCCAASRSRGPNVPARSWAAVNGGARKASPGSPGRMKAK